jgi:hypothetical protein
VILDKLWPAFSAAGLAGVDVNMFAGQILDEPKAK